MLAKAAESSEHVQGRLALKREFESRGYTNVKSPADQIRDMIPDVEGINPAGNKVYGEAKLCEDFPDNDTKDQLRKYGTQLPTGTKIQLAVPSACRASVEGTIIGWGLDGIVQVVGL